MAPCCWAALGVYLTLLAAAVVAANLTDWKFGLWLSIFIAVQVWLDQRAVEQSRPLFVHPSLVLVQIVIAAARGSSLIASHKHWVRRALSRSFLAVRGLIGRWIPRREGRPRRGLASLPGRILSLATLWVAGPVLAALADWRSGTVLIAMAGLLMGARWKALEGSWFLIESPPLWTIYGILLLAMARGIFIIAREQEHWIRQELALAQSPPNAA